MRYDFRKVQTAIDQGGKTLKQVEDLSGVPYQTISRALRTGRASQTTAVKLVVAFGLSMKDIYVKRQRVA